MEKVYKRESFSAEETFAIGKELAAQAKPGEVYSHRALVQDLA